MDGQLKTDRQQPPPPPPQQPPPRPPPHVLLLPLPLQGPLNCFLNLAHLLSLSSPTIQITFLNALFIHRRLPHLPSRFPNFRFSVFSDGISGDHPRPAAHFSAMVRSLEAEIVRRLPEFVPPATCLIADGVFTAVGEAAMGLGIPVVYFSTLSPCCVWAHSGFVPRLIDSGRVPFQEGDDMEEPITNIPGTQTALRRRDLPGICRARDLTEPYIQLITKECRELQNAQGHILNTFDDLEGPLLDHLHSLFPNLYTVGPLHSHLKARLELEPEPQPRSSNSLWQEDRSCIDWLDAQPLRSVLFVSFGSIVAMTIDQLMEFWFGLVNSGVRFLWVRRPGSVVGVEDGIGDEGGLEVPKEVSEGTKERGFVVRWAPQEEVLAHRAIGGFLTHSGWNSNLEGIVEGVPMICWPSGIDQLVNSRFVEEVWKIGIDMKDKCCDRVVIENMVRELMERRRDEFSENAKMLASLAGKAVKKGGSSWNALDRLIEDIKFMRLQAPHNNTS